jgi:hypothetical protein
MSASDVAFSRRTRSRILLGLLACFSACAFGVPSTAVATEAKPFSVTKFSIVPTANTRVTEVGPGEFRFVNEPYASPFTQAGGHPWALTTTAEFSSEEIFEVGSKEPAFSPTRDPKDIVVDLPPGLLGDPVATPRCPLTQVTSSATLCPADTVIGSYVLRWYGGKEQLGPIINIVPEAGQSAEFGLENGTHQTFLLTAHLVRTENGYGFTVTSDDIPLVGLISPELTFWGVPADPSHDRMRGLLCQNVNLSGGTPMKCSEGGDESAGVNPVPFLSLPSDCSVGPEVGTVRVDTWDEPGTVSEGHYSGYAENSTTMPGVTGCDSLQFGASIKVEPNTLLADEPVEMGVNVEVPQSETPEANATPDVRDAVVTLPEGVSVSPGVVDGIQACNESGPEGINFTGPESEVEGLNGELQLAPGHCPDSSIVGSAKAVTPLLDEPIEGHVYLARPLCGGAGQAVCTDQDALDGHLYQLYLELGGRGKLADAGVNIKVPGFVEANPATGQLTTKFLETPQAPYSELHVELNGGPRAPLDNPAACGPAVTSADFTPWSAPGRTPEGLLMPGTPDAIASSYYDVECYGVPGLKPGFLAGTVTPRAGRYSAFTLDLSRQDREQYIKGIQLHTPPGLLALLASVPLCPEDQANDPAKYGECTASKIGTTRVASGAGSHPFEIEGNVYLTGPHDGAPFGLSIVTRAVAGPFNLGLVVVRARIDIDPENSTATITTDETGPYAVPQIIFGVPLRLQRITVDIDRPGFMFNPTNCAAQQITANISGSQNATAAVSSPFAVDGCQSLAFKPKFAVSTSAHTSRTNGASLYVKLSYAAGSLGVDANIAKVKVDLPKQLPSRLTTLQKACPGATFNANPAACPAASIVGIARASTPLLPVGLSGPVYFVSHGGEAFPSLIVVLQGDGVRVDLTGNTFISKAGITSSTFQTVPDVPVNTFELYLPEGRYSALAANGNLCKAKLQMPTDFTAQNGAIVKQNTPIAVTGCTKAKVAIKSKARAKKTRLGHASQGRAHS